jgi:hypothetical protein
MALPAVGPGIPAILAAGATLPTLQDLGIVVEWVAMSQKADVMKASGCSG